jgi:AcrR family transcriptional regulator
VSVTTPALTMRERVIDAAITLTTDDGWAHVTMARLADAVGVSRQTVYNEVGSKPRLAEAMILHELERFLGLVTLAFDAHPTDLVAAIRDAARSVLEASQDNPLLRAIVSATHGADTELLPLLTTHAGALLSTAKVVLVERVAPYGVELSPTQLDAAIDAVVRVVLSHVMQPSASPERTADDVAWIAARVLRP